MFTTATVLLHLVFFSSPVDCTAELTEFLWKSCSRKAETNCFSDSFFFFFPKSNLTLLSLDST